MIDRSYGTAIGMTMNNPAAPTVPRQQHFFDFRQRARKRRPQQPVRGLPQRVPAIVAVTASPFRPTMR